LTFTREFWTEGAEVLITAVGYTARAARAAARQLRAEGLRVGVFQPLTVWPFPEDELLQAAAAAETVVVPEMNMGQLVHEVERIIGREQVLGLHKSNGKPLFIEEIAAKAREAVR
jgi:2-oxoglutarate ferredoxin oxidoreductase subunit alpha